MTVVSNRLFKVAVGAIACLCLLQGVAARPTDDCGEESIAPRSVPVAVPAPTSNVILPKRIPTNIAPVAVPQAKSSSSGDSDCSDCSSDDDTNVAVPVARNTYTVPIRTTAVFVAVAPASTTESDCSDCSSDRKTTVGLPVTVVKTVPTTVRSVVVTKTTTESECSDCSSDQSSSNGGSNSDDCGSDCSNDKGVVAVPVPVIPKCSGSDCGDQKEDCDSDCSNSSSSCSGSNCGSDNNSVGY